MAQRTMPSRNGLSTQQAPTGNMPNQTLYCTNLPGGKIRKEDLKLSLYTLFSTYGPVLDVVVMRTEKMREQAHVVFKDVQTSTQAMRALQGFDFFGRELKIAYARGKSDTIAKLDGTYSMPTAASTIVASTELQQSIFNAPPSAMSPDTTLPKPPTSNTNGIKGLENPAQAAQGLKRPREEESDDDEDAPMEEDSDAPMEDSSDED